MQIYYLQTFLSVYAKLNARHKSPCNQNLYAYSISHNLRKLGPRRKNLLCGCHLFVHIIAMYVYTDFKHISTYVLVLSIILFYYICKLFIVKWQ